MFRRFIAVLADPSVAGLVAVAAGLAVLFGVAVAAVVVGAVVFISSEVAG